MNIQDISLDDLLRSSSGAAAEPSIETVEADVAARGIAIIGMSAQIGRCEDLASFWRLLANGQTAEVQVPAGRAGDLREFLRLKGHAGRFSRDQCLRQSYLPEIDKFDHAFFGLSRQEANFTDPNQRLFLQTAWAALEDAGYGGDSVRGSVTGVYVGFSSDFGEDYRRVVQTFAPDAPEISVAGNIKSIIGSRLAYHLDLRGPSVLVDTACSSGLTAVHLACQALLQGDCQMAVAGAVKLDLVPIKDDAGGGIGTKDIEDTIAADGRTKTFDDRCDGTSGAEGVLAFVLKPLARAIEDRDHIHAVIRATAINQDGLSVGITAPNSAAQEALIVRALALAGVPAESISYVEAHGTATRLGDPIEISGIERAFRQHTDRRQFCAVGSVKTNLGHMDNAAGLAGLAKVVLALRHRELPASLHFNTPNHRIAFERSPVFVNDRHCPWDAPASYPRRAGINSFGLSGTNAHVIVEEYIDSETRPAPVAPFLLPLSARSDEALRALAGRYAVYLRDPASAGCRPDDLCFTAATGRRHHEHRLAICFRTLDELRSGLDDFVRRRSSAGDTSWWQGSFRLVAGERGIRPGELTEAAQDSLTRQADALRSRSTGMNRAAQFPNLARLYVAGAAVAWDSWFAGQLCGRVSLPTYPFARERCWVETTARGESLARRGNFHEKGLHPLLSNLAAETEGLRLYITPLSATSHWELADHKVRGACILPGTCFVEMILAASSQLRGNSFAPLRLEEIQFLHPLVVGEGETRDTHVQIRSEPGGWVVRILSRSNTTTETWETHAEARISGTPPSVPGIARADVLRDLRARLPLEVTFARQDDLSRGLEIGRRWNESFVAGWQSVDGTESLVNLRLPEAFASEAGIYQLHPALLDTAVNAMNHRLGSGSLYLPFSYKTLDVHRPLPPEFYAHLSRQGDGSEELISLDVDLYDLEGNLCASARSYRVKRVPDGERIGVSDAPSLFHAVQWIEEAGSNVLPETIVSDRPLLLVRLDLPSQDALAGELRARGYDVTEIAIETNQASTTMDRPETGSPEGIIRIGSDPAQLIKTLGQVPSQSWCGAIYAAGLPDESVPRLREDEECLAAVVRLGAFFQGLLHHRVQLAGPLLVTTRLGQTVANGFPPVLLPAFVSRQAALGAFAHIAGLENPHLDIRVVDTDEEDDKGCLFRELARTDRSSLSVWRQGTRLSPRLHTIEDTSGATPVVLDSEGVYLITGGTGALGLEFALELARQGPRLRLVLLGQHALAERSEWSRLATDPERRTAHRYERLQALSEIADIECPALDVSDPQALAALLEDVRQRRGPIRGVVHAAGRAGEGFLINKPVDQIRKVLGPKVAGAWLLHQLTRGDDLQFFVLYSSIATVLHNPGQSDYTAANAFLDALAHFRRSRDLPALSVCWPAWREVGIAVDYGAVDEQEFFSPIATRTALDGLRLALALQRELPPAVIVGERNARLTREEVEGLGLALSPNLLRRLKHASAKNAPAARNGTSRPADVVLRGLDTIDEFDWLVAQVWGETLALSELEVDVPFADLGGNSILITQMFKSYETHHRGVMEMADLFSLNTVRKQAAHFRQAVQKKPATDVDAVLERLARGELSIEEAGRFI